MTGGLRSLAALAGSVGLHLGAVIVLSPFLAPVPVPQQGGGTSEVKLAVMRVPQAAAEAQDARGSAAEEAQAGGARRGAQVVPVGRAQIIKEGGATAARLSVAGKALSSQSAGEPMTAMRDNAARKALSVDPSGGAVPPVPEKGTAVAAVARIAEAEMPRRVEARRTPRAAPTSERREASPILAMVVAASHDDAIIQAALRKSDPLVGALQPDKSPRIAPAITEGPPAAAMPPPDNAALTVEGAARPVARVPGPPTTAATRPAGALRAPERPDAPVVFAGLAWSADSAMTLDAAGLGTVQAFLAPGSGGGREVRDQMERLLSGPDCARVHTVFEPDTGALTLAGHVAAPGDISTLMQALRAEIGDALPLQSRLQILPRPQCDILGTLDRLGLPQSEDQTDDALMLGARTQVQDVRYSDGQRLALDLSGADYPAYFYVDYFDASGAVVHLTPNRILPLQRHPAQAAFTLGRDDAFDIRISAPFGQDIVVVFAASAPLYQGLRPLREDAAPYLDWLRGRIATASRDPNFKGEWVYIFVATGPAG